MTTRTERHILTTPTRAGLLAVLLGLALVAGCGRNEGEPREHGQGAPAAKGQSAHGGGSRGMGPGGTGGGPVAAVPVEVASVERREISSYIETNGTLEAENEVDIVARTAAPIVELRVEEGMRVAAGQLLARLEQDEILARLEISRVTLNETRLAYERAQSLRGEDLISDEAYEQAKADFESARAQVEGDEVQLGYTEIRAPFAGLIIARYIDFAQQVSANTPLFRLSDFTPLLCPIQVPERELQKLQLDQRAYLTVEAFPGRRFDARVLRISPVVDAATGTVKVTLDVSAEGVLRPGMFSRVFLETERRGDALVVPKAALSLESIGDTVYVADGGAAARREVSLGFTEGDFVELLSGVTEGEAVVVVGQEGLSDGTPLRVLRRDGAAVQGAPLPAEQRKGAAQPAERRKGAPPRSR